jgi:hypothetical protein
MVMLLAAVVVFSSSLVAMDSPPASAKSKVVVATGSVVCTKVTGSSTFYPPVRHIGTGPETQVFVFHASGCTTSKSNVKHVTSGSLTVSIHRASNSCVDALLSQPSKGSGTWKPNSIHSTTASFSGFSFVNNKAGKAGFTVPNVGGKAVVTGSFAGTDHGARSTATFYTNMSALQFHAACLKPGGLARQPIVSGTANFS